MIPQAAIAPLAGLSVFGLLEVVAHTSLDKMTRAALKMLQEEATPSPLGATASAEGAIDPRIRVRRT